MVGKHIKFDIVPTTLLIDKMDYKNFVEYNYDTPNTLNLRDYNFDVRGLTATRIFSIPIVVAPYGWFRLNDDGEIITFINDKRIGRGQKPLEAEVYYQAKNYREPDKNYRCDPDLVEAVDMLNKKNKSKGTIMDPRMRRGTLIIELIKATSFKHGTWSLESDTSVFSEEGRDILDENVEKGLILETIEQNSIPPIVPNTVSVTSMNCGEGPVCDAPSNAEFYLHLSQKYRKLLDDLEIVSSKMVAENRELKEEIERLKYENKIMPKSRIAINAF
jgi:hypothetical protein